MFRKKVKNNELPKESVTVILDENTDYSHVVPKADYEDALQFPETAIDENRKFINEADVSEQLFEYREAFIEALYQKNVSKLYSIHTKRVHTWNEIKRGASVQALRCDLHLNLLDTIEAVLATTKGESK